MYWIVINGPLNTNQWLYNVETIFSSKLMDIILYDFELVLSWFISKSMVHHLRCFWPHPTMNWKLKNTIYHGGICSKLKYAASVNHFCNSFTVKYFHSRESIFFLLWSNCGNYRVLAVGYSYNHSACGTLRMVRVCLSVGQELCGCWSWSCRTFVYTNSKHAWSTGCQRAVHFT